MTLLAKLHECLPILRDMKSSANHPPPPPTYTATQTALLQRVPNYTTTIKAANVPQWAWTNAQCKEWLFAVCYDTLGLTGEEAKVISDKFDGFGPVLYCMDYKEWYKLLGSENRARGVYATLLNVQHEPGAIPDGMVLKPKGKK
jgi:hypothetical protein